MPPTSSQAEENVVNLNDLLKSRFDEWIAWLTRRLSTNGTTSDPFDYSRVAHGDEVNATLSFPYSLLGLACMYEGTTNEYYLRKLQVFIDGAIDNDMNYVTVDNIGEIFFPIAYYYDEYDHDTGSIYPAIFGYISTQLYLWTGLTKYKAMADRIASESYDKLAVVKNHTDIAWSWAYYRHRDETNAKIGVNRQTFFAWFYSLYGKEINSTFSPFVARITHWTWRALLPDGSLSYDIGSTQPNKCYTAFSVWATLNAHIIDPSLLSPQLKDEISETAKWLNTNYSGGYEYQALYFLVPALLVALKTDYFSASVSPIRAKSMLYIALNSMHLTEKGFVTRLDHYSFGFKWHQLTVSGLFTSYPLTDHQLDLSLLNPITTNEVDQGKYALNGWTGGVFATYITDGRNNYGSQIVRASGRSFNFLPFGYIPPPSSVLIANNTYYVRVQSTYSTYTVDYYGYPSGVFVGDVTGTTSSSFVLDNNENWRVKTVNGSEWQAISLVNGNLYDFGTSFLVYLNDSSFANRRSFFVKSPTPTWKYAFVSSMHLFNFSQVQTNYRIIFAEIESFGHLIPNADVMFDVLRSLVESHDTVQPTSFAESFYAYHNNVAELEPDASWKQIYENSSASEVKLIGHDVPEKVSITSWNQAKETLAFSINSPIGALCQVKLYVGAKGMPVEVRGVSDWDFDAATKTVTATVLLGPGSTNVAMRWVEHNPPSTTITLVGTQGSNDWFTSDVTLSLSATDDESGVNKTEYSFNNVTWHSYATPFVINAEGNNTLYYRAIDNDGNIETAQSKAIKIDKTPPQGSIQINLGTPFTNMPQVTLMLTSNDTVSGVDKVRFSNDGVFDTEVWEEPTPDEAWMLTAGDGAKTIFYQIMDNAGFVSETYSDSIVLDTHAPVASAGYDLTINEDMLLTLNGTTSWDENGIISYIWVFSDNISRVLHGETPIITFSIPGTYEVTLKVIDAAGNWATDATTIIVLDVTKPVAIIGENQRAKPGEMLAFNASASNDNVGIVAYEWNFGDNSQGSGMITTHHYTSPGSYVVTLTVRDASGNVGSRSIIVVVQSEDEGKTGGIILQIWVLGAAVIIISAAFTTAALLLKKRMQRNQSGREIWAHSGEST